MPDTAPLILTLLLDEASQAFFDRARERWFPAKLNFIRAHVTMFHHLPGAGTFSIVDDLATVCAGQRFAEVTVTGVRFLGRGVAYSLNAPEAELLRSRLAARWRDHLTAQDRQRWQPHVTVQNKVSPTEARDLTARLSSSFVSFKGRSTGVAVWRYRGGPWESEAVLPFGAGA